MCFKSVNCLTLAIFIIILRNSSVKLHMELYTAHNDCLVYLERHSVTMIPASSLHCKLLGMVWDTKTQGFLMYVTVSLQSWWSVSFGSSVVYLKIPVTSIVLLGRATEDNPGYLDTCSEGCPTTKAAELNVLPFVVQVQCWDPSEAEDDTRFRNAVGTTHTVSCFGLVFDSKLKPSNKPIV